MRKQWLIPIIGTIGNFFSVIMMWFFPILIAMLILSGIFHVPDRVLSFIIVIFVLGYPSYLFYLGASGKGENKVKKYLPSRPMTAEEEAIFLPLIEEVIAKHNVCSNTNLIFGKDLQFSIAEDDTVNAFAFGKTHVIFNTGFLASASPEMFKSVLAHEIGHLHNKDTLISLANFFVQRPTQVVLKIFNSYKVMGHLADAAKNHKGSGDKAMVNLAYKILFLPALIVGLVVNFICDTSQKILSKQQELEADAYAVKLGYSNGLLEFLEMAKNSHTKPNRLVRLFESHPEPGIRIENIHLLLN